MRSVVYCLICVLFVSAPAFAQSNLTDSVTITTYYPSPYGVYRNLKLNPTTQPTGNAVHRGVMFFNTSDDRIYVYTRNGWEYLSYGSDSGGSGDVCGDGACGSTETAENCPADCGGSSFPPKSCSVGGGCSNCGSSGNYWNGIKTSILENDCRTYCSDKGKQYDTYGCTDERTISYSNSITFTSLSFHDCRPTCPSSCGGGSGKYCYKGATATCRCK